MSKNGVVPKHRFRMTALRALLNALRDLYLRMGTTLLHKRMQPPASPPTAGSSANIADSMRDHIEQTAAKVATSEQSGPDADSLAAVEATAGQPASAGRNDEALRPNLFDGLAKRFRRNRQAGKLEPHLREKMRTNTLAHINKSMRFARQGKAEAAKIHAELAESAMKTASEYMTEEEYRAFEQDVKEKLKAIGSLVKDR